MRDKRVYNKAIAISDKDLEYIKTLKANKKFSKKCLAGILSFIINSFKRNKK